MMELPDKVDPRSEMLLLSTYGNTKNILANVVEMEGQLDEEAMVLAFRNAAKSFPHLLSRIKEVKARWLHHLVWENQPDALLPATISEIQPPDDASPLLDPILSHLRPHLDREWDLFAEYPIDFHLVRFGRNRSAVVVSFPHVSSDAATAAEFGKELFAQYHEIKKGKRPEWAAETHAISSSVKRKARIQPARWGEALVGAKDTLVNLLDKPVLATGTGDPADPTEYQIKRVLSREKTVYVGKRAARQGVSPIDLFTACGKIAVDRWNEARNIPPGLLTCSMTVNARGRYGSAHQPNNSSVIFFRSLPQERQNLAKFCKKLALTRINHFRKQLDIRYIHDIERMINSLRPLPFHLRRRIVHHVVNRHQFSIAVTLLGVLWPKMRNGKPSSETALTSTADLVLKEVHGIAYKLLTSNHLLLIVYTFDSKLNLILACSAARFTREEAESFMDLLVDTLTDYPMTGGR